jgi:hypothetical protein
VIKKSPWKVHPVWRGIGCLMMIIIPVMSYAGAVLLVQENFKRHWVPVPAELIMTVTLPRIGSFPYLYATLMTMLLLMFIGFGAMMIIYTIIYRFVGPSLLGPMDVPLERPPKKKRR